MDYQPPSFSSLAAIEKQAREIPLVNAITENNFQKVNELIKSGVDVNIHIPGGGKTPLHLAIELGYEKIILALINAKADVNAVTKRGFTPLHIAAQRGNKNLIALLVSSGSNINVCNDGGTTPLHEAAANGHKDAVIKLLELKANPDIKDNRYNLTAANLAQKNGYESIRDILVAAMTYQQKFIQDVHYILFSCKKVFLQNSAEYQFINNLSNSIRLIEDADKVFIKINSVLKTHEYTQVEKLLVSMRKLLITSMKQYNLDKTEHLKKANQETKPVGHGDAELINQHGLLTSITVTPFDSHQEQNVDDATDRHFQFKPK